MSTMPHGFNAVTVTRLTGLTYRKLGYLDRIGLVKPSIRQATGSGSRRVYSFEDLVSLRVLAEARLSGISLQALRTAIEHLQKRQAAGRKPIARLSLTWHGKQLFVRTDNPKTLEDLTAGGQFAMVLPVEKIVRDLGKQVTEISAPRRFTVKAKGREFEAIATPDLEAGGYTIEILGAPGCFSEAESMRDAPREAREALEAYFGAGVPVDAHHKRIAR